MKMLIPHNRDYYSEKTSYFENLINSYVENGIEVTTGTENFFLDRKEYDIVQIHWPEHILQHYNYQSEEHAYEMYVQRLSKIKRSSLCIWVAHNFITHRKKDSKLHYNLYQSTINSVHGIMHHSPYSHELINRKYRIPPFTRHIVIPHGNFKHIKNIHSKSESRRYLGFEKNAFIYMFIGQMSSYKGPELVLDAYLSIYDKASLDLHLVYNSWCGSHKYIDHKSCLNNYEEWLKYEGKRYSENYSKGVRLLLGIKNENVLVSIMKSADVIVLGHQASLTSGIPMLASSFKLPIIAPDTGSMRYYVKNSFGILYKPGDLNSLKNAMMLAQSRDFSNGVLDQKIICESGEWKKCASDTISWFDELLRECH